MLCKIAKEVALCYHQAIDLAEVELLMSTSSCGSVTEQNNSNLEASEICPQNEGLIQSCKELWGRGLRPGQE